MNKSVTVIGIGTGSNDIEAWLFAENDPLLKRFCENLCRDTLKTVYVIDGVVLGKYQVKIPVEYFPEMETYETPKHP